MMKLVANLIFCEKNFFKTILKEFCCKHFLHVFLNDDLSFILIFKKNDFLQDKEFFQVHEDKISDKGAS